MTDMAEVAVSQQSHVSATTIRALRRSDLDFAARLHARALPHGFFGRLGPRFLTRYYESFASSPHAVAFVAIVDGERAGMLVGTVSNVEHYRWLLRRRGVTLAWTGLLALLARPAQLRLFVRTRVGRYLRGIRRLRMPSHQTREGCAAGRVAVLTHVAVNAAGRGAGTGSALVEAFIAAARSAGCAEACLVTLSGPEGAGPFYKRLGWTHLEDRLDSDGRGISVFARLL